MIFASKRQFHRYIWLNNGNNVLIIIWWVHNPWQMILTANIMILGFSISNKRILMFCYLRTTNMLKSVWTDTSKSQHYLTIISFLNAKPKTQGTYEYKAPWNILSNEKQFALYYHFGGDLVENNFVQIMRLIYNCHFHTALLPISARVSIWNSRYACFLLLLLH